MKNYNLKISSNWKIHRDEFYDIDPFDKSISDNEKLLNVFYQEELLLLNNGEYYIDLGWYGGNQNGHYKLYLYKGENWHNCQLLEKFSTIEYQFLTKSINTIARNVDDKFYDKIDTNCGSIDEFSSNELVSKFQITHSILKHPDKILALEFYLKSNKNDNEGDSWFFGHNPNIENHLLSLTEQDSIKLQTEIFNWNEFEKFKIADPISDTKNKYIDGHYIYGKIFLSIDDFEKLEYLIQNLVVIVWGAKKKTN
ncbi:MAG: hypothetical protein IPL95_19310 [Saprospiraceae bacterium]|nr:hypothetical protein [Saprospiraceae bacterium]